MFPLRDDNPTERFPFFTLAFMGACVAVWVLVQGAGLDGAVLNASVCALGAIPAEVTGRPLGGGPCASGGFTWEGVVTSMFLHGSWMHLIGNLWFLWVFGNNVEDAMGHGRFLVFYVGAGVAATLAHVATDPASAVPLVGASGAISAVMGAYLVLYPRARVHTLFWFLFFIRVVPLPAWVILGYWFVIQLLAAGTGAGGGVAYAAHVGGFVAGLVLVPFFARPGSVGAKRRGLVLRGRRGSGRGWW